MIPKEYGKLTFEQLEILTNRIHEARQLGQSLERTMQEAEPEKLKTILGDNFSWFDFYELSFNEHIGAVVIIFGWQDALHHAVETDDPQQSFLDFVDSLDPDDDWQGGYQGMFEKKHLVSAVVSMIKTIKSIMVYQKSLSTLIEEVRAGNDKSLFDAVRIDRSIVASPSIAHRISMAELLGDQKFFLHLKKALKGPSRKHMVGLEEMRYMLHVLVEAGPDQLSNQALETLLVDQLKLYPMTPGAQKNLSKHYAYSKKVHHRK